MEVGRCWIGSREKKNFKRYYGNSGERIEEGAFQGTE